MTTEDKPVRSQAAGEAEIKTIGASGQLYFGKAYAGKTVVIEKREPGVWLVRTASVVPDNERWLHTMEMQAKLNEAFEWMESSPSQAVTLEDIEKLRAL
ncbi:hypothetical protein [Deinococcus sp.]|uniref:hypothetical protein n=1 Tax=Deinococcus sp. TaxID=47478 RepID=UPI0025FAA27B|nr:hypothetical protein [Deinococcus sp.]